MRRENSKAVNISVEYWEERSSMTEWLLPTSQYIVRFAQNILRNCGTYEVEPD